MREAIKTKKLLSLEHTIAAKLFENAVYPWEVLSNIKEFILQLGPSLGEDYVLMGENVWVAKDAEIAPTACINGPCIIDKGAEIRHCAYIRGSAIIGKKCVVGNSTEIKNAVLFDNVQVPHYNYVGDSVLGYHAHMGAGAIASNFKSDKSNVSVLRPDGGRMQTGLRKFGAILGDDVEVGCNSVLCPGTVVGRNTTIYPLSRVRGFVEEERIFKDPHNVVEKKFRGE